MTTQELIDQLRKRSRLLKQNGPFGVALVEALKKLDEKIETATKGDDGKTPIAGVDFPLPENGMDGRDGEDGRDGVSPNPDLIVQEVLAKVPPAKDGRDGRDGYTPIKDKDYFDGNDGSPDTPGQIKGKLESLKDDERLDASAIKNLPTVTRELPTISLFGNRTGGGSQMQVLVNNFSLGQDVRKVLLSGTGVTGRRISDGVVEVSIASSATIDDLTDVLITSPSDNDLLAFDSASGNWINQTAAQAGLSAVGHTHTATQVSIADAGGYYTGADVEAALQEVGASIGVLPTTYLKLDASNDPVTGQLDITRVVNTNAEIIGLNVSVTNQSSGGLSEAVAIKATAIPSGLLAYVLDFTLDLVNAVGGGGTAYFGQQITIKDTPNNTEASGINIALSSQGTGTIHTGYVAVLAGNNSSDTVKGAHLVATGATTNYALELFAVGGTTKHALHVDGGDVYLEDAFGAGAPSIRLVSDTGRLYFGNLSTGDASIHYNGTNLIIDPKITGSGVLAVSGNVTVTDEAYGSGWNGVLQVPTKNAVYDKIESLVSGVSSVTAANATLTISPTTGAVIVGLNLSNANTWLADQSVPDEVYDATAWNGSVEVPTKNALRDKFESLVTGVSSVTATNSTLTISPTTGAVLAGINLANVNTWTGAQTVDANFAVGTSGGTGRTATFHHSTAGVNMQWNGAAGTTSPLLTMTIQPARTTYLSISGTDTNPQSMATGIIAIFPTFNTGTAGKTSNLLYFVLTDDRSISSASNEVRIFRGEIAKGGTKTSAVADNIYYADFTLTDASTFNGAGGTSNRSFLRGNVVSGDPVIFANATAQTINYRGAHFFGTITVDNQAGTNVINSYGVDIADGYNETITAGAVTATKIGLFYHPATLSALDEEWAVKANRAGILLASDGVSATMSGGRLVQGGGSDSEIFYDGTDLVINTALVGTGVLKLANATNWTANGANTVTISNVAPAGVGTATIGKWLTVKDDAGTVYYIPAWT